MVYVDTAAIQKGGRTWFHMLSDGSLDELHEIAGKIGLKREWFQDRDIPHYDVVTGKKHRAIQEGAEVANFEKMKELLAYWRTQKNAKNESKTT
jgi:hypothetical protein